MKIKLPKINLQPLKVKFSKALPGLMIGAGCVGIGYSAWKACEATPKAKEIINRFTEKREPLSDNDTKEIIALYKEAGWELTKLYFKPVGVGLLSVTMIFLGHGKLKKEIATLTTTAASLDGLLKEYRGRVVEKYGEEEDRALMHGTHQVEVEEKVTDKNGKEKIITKKVKVDELTGCSIYSRFFDESNPEFKNDPSYNRFFLSNAEDFCNRKLKADGYLFLNDVLDMLGYKRCSEGAVIGWMYDPENPEYHNHVSFGMMDTQRVATRDFINGYESRILLDFNVDGVIYDKIPVFSEI